MNLRLIRQIEDFNEEVKIAVSNPKSLNLTLEKLFGIRRKLRWLYRQTENAIGRDSIVQRYLKFMIGLKTDDFKGYEYLKFRIDGFLESAEIVGCPHLLPANPLQQAIEEIEASLMKVKSLLNN